MENKNMNRERLDRVNHLAGELRILMSRLAAARVRVIVAALLLAVGIPLEWAFGVDFFSEFVRNEAGDINPSDLIMVRFKGLMLLGAVVILKYAVLSLSKKARKHVFLVAGLAAIVMLAGVGLARNDLMHMKRQEMTSTQAATSGDTQLSALGLAAPAATKPKESTGQSTREGLEKGLLSHTNFLAVVYVLISLGSAICLVEILEQWPKLGKLKWAREHLAKTQRLRELQKSALSARIAQETLTENQPVLMRAAQDLVIRTHLDGLSYTPWWRNTFRLFHIKDNDKINTSQVYGLRWLKALNCETAKEEIEACHQALGKLKLVQPVYPRPLPPNDNPPKEASNV